MKIFIAAAALVALLSSTGLSAPPAGSPVKPVNYKDVQKNPQKHLGQKVSWIGQEVTYSTSRGDDGKKEVRYIFLWRNASGRFLADNPILVTGEITHTPAAEKARGTIRRITGTLIGVSPVTLTGSDKQIDAPELSDATIDVAGR